MRALAVIAVLLSHLKVPNFGGGYVGVDMFFVISGYVIYGDYRRRTAAGPFSPAAFLLRRLRRLAPQLFTMLAAVLVASALILLPSDFQRMPARLLATALGLSNWLFAYQSDYFAPSSEWNILLHTWTLSVEAQYYFGFPLLILLLARQRSGALPAGLAAMALLSLAYCLLPRADGGAVYFDTFARAWEFFLGSLLQHLRLPRVRKSLSTLVSVIALSALIASITLFGRDSGYPDWRVLVPTLATAALIVFLPDSGLHRPFESRAAVGTGRMSYAIYIWHWPLIAFATYVWPDLLENIAASLMLMIAVAAVSWITWRYVEEPMRRPIISDPLFRQALLASLLLLCSISGVAWLMRGWPERFDREVVELDSYVSDVNPRKNKCHRRSFDQLPLARSCTYGAAATPTIAVWSDSHGVELIAALTPWLSKHGKSAVQYSFSSCPPVAATSWATDCERFNAQTFLRLVHDPQIREVILAGALDNPRYLSNVRWKQEFLTAANGLLARGKRLILIYPVPNQSFLVPRTMANAFRFSIPYEDARVRQADYLYRIRAVSAVYDSLGNDNVFRVYPHHVFCQTGICEVSLDGRPMYFDDNHLNLIGARQLAAKVTLGMDR